MKQYTQYLPWVAAAAILVVIFGALYATVQQAERTGANFPQVQVAEDIASVLNQGGKPSSYAVGRVEMSQSLAPFVIIYDRSGKAVASSGYLGGQVPSLPIGALTASQGQDYHAVTWQPQSGVRIAAVAVAANKYYVVSGRNLREVEKNEDLTLWRSVMAGIVSWLLLGATFLAMNWSKTPTRK